MSHASNSGSTFKDYLLLQPKHIWHLLGNLQAEDADTAYWIDALNNNTVTIATDRSVAENRGYFALIFHTEDRQLHFQGPCDGHESLMTSYRSELTGMLSALYLLWALSQYTTTPLSCKQQLFCDISAAVTHTNYTIAPGIKAHIAAEYNLSQEICSVKEKGIDLQTHWVKAHQDDKTSFALLPLDAQLNI
eukprot:15366463-Ditylum_brightwellii.AAC.1